MQSGIHAYQCFQRCRQAKNRQERHRFYYEAERLRAEAVSHALLADDFEVLLGDLAGLLDGIRDSVLRKHVRLRGPSARRTVRSEPERMRAAKVISLQRSA